MARKVHFKYMYIYIHICLIRKQCYSDYEILNNVLILIRSRNCVRHTIMSQSKQRTYINKLTRANQNNVC